MNHFDELDTDIPRPSYLKDAEGHIKKFGRIVGTTGIRPVPGEILERLISRHISTDWGDLCREDRELNDLAFKMKLAGDFFLHMMMPSMVKPFGLSPVGTETTPIM